MYPIKYLTLLAPLLLSVGCEKRTQETPRTIFISPEGKGDICTLKEPCSLMILDHKKRRAYNIKAGDKILFRGGLYSYTMKGVERIQLQGGTEKAPIVYESYPNELAIFDGSQLNLKEIEKKEWREGRLELHGDHIVLRNIEVQNMPQYGIRIFGNHNLVEKCRVHDNHLSGIEILNKKDGYSPKDTGGSYNRVQYNIVYNNSDVGLEYGNYKNGDNADGITIHSGVDNLIQYNTIYSNSDDGIDTYKSIHTRVEHNLIYDHGVGRGNANGIKLGGPDPQLSINSVAQYNIVHSNRGFGITVHGTENNSTILYNTSYNNAKAGYAILDDTRLSYNISYHNREGDVVWSKGREQKENSWQLYKPNQLLEFISLDPDAEGFLYPVQHNLSRIGAYAHKGVSK